MAGRSRLWEWEGKGEEPGMRIGLGWGVGSTAEKKPLRVFLWEAENWIPLAGRSIELFQAGQGGSAASPPLSLTLSSIQRCWEMTETALPALIPTICGEEPPSPVPFAVYHPKLQFLVAAEVVSLHGAPGRGQPGQAQEYLGLHGTTRNRSRRAMNTALRSVVGS